jgi:signal transduction histidine kinase
VYGESAADGAGRRTVQADSLLGDAPERESWPSPAMRCAAVETPEAAFYRRSMPIERSRAASGRFGGLTVGALVFDGALSIAAGAVVLVLSALAAGFAELPVMVGTVVLCAAALLVRRVWPWAVLAVVCAVTTGYLAAGYPSKAIIGMVSVAIYAVAQRTSWCRSLAAGGLALCAILPSYLVQAEHTQEVWGATSLIAMALLLPAALAVAVRLRRESVARAGAEEIRHRVEEERLEIAREVHDALGHALAVIHMQAGVALHVRATRPGQVKEALEAVGQASREALTELDATFGVFRESQEPVADRPDLGLDQLDTLLAVMRRVGLDVDLTVAGPRTVLSPEVERAAYRITQESLTNVLHHAGAVRATVELRYEPAALSLQISNEEGAMRGAPNATGGGGNGIPGMRERTTALGGTLEAGPRMDGGFLVAARLPLKDCCP